MKSSILQTSEFDEVYLSIIGLESHPMLEKDDLVEKILKAELSMFLSVPSRYPARCREHPDVFRLHREAQFSAWSEEALQSYLDDLLKAREEGLNLMTLKYARMENLVDPLNPNPIIEKII